ncbi:protein of unknown function [Petrocella atlantisensis]|uniref:Uncharacterized protein n=1 Tax=Petrocella atlantisensis TaxID=2173034 RepID=A0A3P7NY04_9FIRM|nr:protein of unknown function [Petrocella atlantisensis]
MLFSNIEMELFGIGFNKKDNTIVNLSAHSDLSRNRLQLK